MNFKIVTALTGLVCLILAGVWFAFPQWILLHWHVDYAYGAGFISRRMACLFLIVGMLLIDLRNIHAQDTQNAVSKAVIIGCSALIGLGTYELFANRVNDGIMVAMGLECLICVAFLTVSRPTVAPLNAPECSEPPVIVRSGLLR